jgi:dTDP-4-amino-4,6-dideoxygalactose transaminase
LHAALYVLGVSAGDEVLVAPTASLPSIMPILSCGARPVFVDTAAGGFGFEVDDLRSKLSGSVRAALSVPMWGYPSESPEALALLEHSGVPLIEDAAQAHGARYERGFVGTVGRLGCFSTHDRKALSTGEGGFVLTDDADLADSLRRFIRIGNMDGVHYGVNFKPTAMQAALGMSRLAYLSTVVSTNQALADRFLRSIEGLPLKDMSVPQGSKPSYYGLVLLTDGARLSASDIARHCMSRGIPSDIARYDFKAAYRRQVFAGYDHGVCPNSEKTIAEMVTFPIHNGLGNADIDYMAGALNEVFDRAGIGR